MRYFYRRNVNIAFAVLLQLLDRKVIFTRTVCRLLDVNDVIEVAVTVGYNSVCAYVNAFVQLTELTRSMLLLHCLHRLNGFSVLVFFCYSF